LRGLCEDGRTKRGWVWEGEAQFISNSLHTTGHKLGTINGRNVFRLVPRTVHYLCFISFGYY